MQALTVGDKVKDDSLIILDEDRLCYSVRLVSNGKASVRTISKVLLTEWVTVYRQTPNLPAQTVKSQLVGKSDIDSFEYGDAETLAKMAKMILGQISVVHAKADYADAFCKWFAENRGKGKVATAKKYITYFKTLTDSYKAPTHSFWHGLYRIMYGHDAEKVVIEIGELAEFDRIFGGVITTLETKVKSPGMTDEGCQKAVDWFWKPEVKPHTCVTSALKAYRDFLKWREEEQKKNDEPKLDAADLLTVALKMFAEKRRDDGEGGWFKSGCEVNGRIREYFDPLTVAALQAFDDAKIEELFCGKKGADGKVELETMWSGKPGMGWANIKPKTAQETQNVREFLCKLKSDAGVVAAFRQTGFVRPNGFGPSVISELLMKFHPESCIKHGEVGHKVLTWLGMIDSAWNREYSDGDYKQVCGAAAKIIAKMKAMNIPRQINADGNEEASPPDYLTVNEFIWFVNENLDLIKEKIMSKAMKKPTTKKITTGKASISKLLTNKEDSLMTMLVAGLLTKPLAILAGVSGTGKSRMVRHLAYKTCLDEDLKPSGESAPGNFKMVQVKPSWHDSADLLGYRSAVNEKHEYVSTDFVKFVLKAHAYPNTPFFVCLDEMNLAPVEHYFAEFLSACESIRKSDVTGEWTSDPIVAATDFDNDVLNLGGDVLFESADAALDAALKKTKARIEKEGLFIPRNLFVVGTVNMDDSTGGFSRKVLDRAMTIVMNEVHFEDLQKEDKDLTLSDDNLFTTTEIAKFIERKDFNKDMMSDDFRDQLENIRQKLAKTPFALAYRFARETCMYKNALKEILDAAEVVKDSEGNPKKDASGAAIDADRACGDIALDHMILMKLLPRLTGTTEQRSAVLKDIKEYLGKLVKDKKVSALTLDEMEERAKGNGGYLSFWP